LKHPLIRRSLTRVLEAIGLVAVAASLGGAVRLLPWLLDPSVTFRLAAPFARGLLALAIEAAILIGWPVGWALAAVQVVERGEGRALASLGESPAASAFRLLPQAAAFALALGVVSFIGGQDASAPGRVVTDLIARGRESCETVESPTTFVVPFAGVTWLCAPGLLPHLVGKGPGAFARTELTATDARAAGDLRAIDLDEARLHLALGGQGVDVHVGALHLRGLSPFGHASSVPPPARALALALAGLVAATASLLSILTGVLRGRLEAIVAAASGSLATLGAMRAIERASGAWLATLAVPFLALGTALLVTAVLSRLPRRMRTASK